MLVASYLAKHYGLKLLPWTPNCPDSIFSGGKDFLKWTSVTSEATSSWSANLSSDAKWIVFAISLMFNSEYALTHCVTKYIAALIGRRNILAL